LLKINKRYEQEWTCLFWLQDYASQGLRYKRNPNSEIAIIIR
jgi:hypothetical protein